MRIFRFAPSPNGYLHLGHAYSALLNQQLAAATGGRLLLRVEDIDQSRCSAAFESAMFEDLGWLGLTWEEPVRRQSEHFAAYTSALDELESQNLLKRSYITRGELRSAAARAESAGRNWPRDPDGALLPPADEMLLGSDELARRRRAGSSFALRLDMRAALARLGTPLAWTETGAGPDGATGRVTADPAAWGDVVLARKDVPTSYHLAVTLDDALQGVTDVVRGRDLFFATAVHRVLQRLLDLPEPRYHHHDLVLDADGRKLSKSASDTALRELRAQGWSPEDVRRRIGLATG